MSVLDKFQLGVADEIPGSYGTPAVATRFFEANKETIKRDDGGTRVESKGLRRGTRVLRSDRWAPGVIRVAGDVEFEVHTKGAGFWLKHLVGTVASGAPNGDGKTVHTGTIGEMTGDSFTLQLNRPFHPANTDQAFTHHGGKVASWKVENEVGGILMLVPTFDFEDVDTATGLAVASYPTDTEVVTFVGGSCEIADVAYDINKVSFEMKNGLNVERDYLGRRLKKEPNENEFREITAEIVGDFEDLTHYNRFVSATRAGALAKLELIWQGPTAIGGASFPDFVITIPNFRFDGDNPTVDGPAALMQTLKGKGVDQDLTVAYGTADATP